jgi:hypothetical protein
MSPAHVPSPKPFSPRKKRLINGFLALHIVCLAVAQLVAASSRFLILLLFYNNLEKQITAY